MKINLLNRPDVHSETVLTCPNCESSEVRLSSRQRSHAIRDYLFPRTFYRCMQCGRYLYLPSVPVKRWGITIAGCIIVGFLGLYTLFDLTDEGIPPGSETKNLAQQAITNTRAPSGPSNLNAAEFSKEPEAPGQNDMLDSGQPLAAHKAGAPPAEQPKEETQEVKGKNETLAAKYEASAAKMNTAPESKIAALPQDTTRKASEEKEKTAQTGPTQVTAKKTVAGGAEALISPPLSKEKVHHVLKDVKQLSAKGELVIVVVSDGPIQDYTSFFLDKPPRQVVDFAGIWQISDQMVIDVHSDIAKRIRLGKHPDKLRLVVDLTTGELRSPVIEESPSGVTIFLQHKS